MFSEENLFEFEIRRTGMTSWVSPKFLLESYAYYEQLLECLKTVRHPSLTPQTHKRLA
jgi:hypothetical protein